MSLNETLAKWAQAGAALNPGACGKMCGVCLFKLGTVPNLDKNNVRDAADCLWIPERPFYCAHSGVPEAEEPICTGYQYALKYMESEEFKMNSSKKLKTQ